MDIECTLDFGDIEAFTRYASKHIQSVTKMLRKHRIFYGCFTIITLYMSLFFVTRIPLVPGLITFIFPIYGAVRFILLRTIWINWVLNQARKTHTSGKNEIIGKHRFLLSDEGIRDISETGDRITNWDFITKIVLTDTHIFIIFNPDTNAVYIPKRAFSDDAAYNRFYETAKQYTSRAFTKKQ